jgi:[glutamine synthetase] adenylyltransferase / [glutamine synthetase]-adenylyl-L-tyrosine phosphorylase
MQAENNISAEHVSEYLAGQYSAKPYLKTALKQNTYSVIDLNAIHELYLKYQNLVKKEKGIEQPLFQSEQEKTQYAIQITHQSLRLLRNHILCNLIERQFQNKCDYYEVTHVMSIFADFALNTLVELHTQQLNCIYYAPLDLQNKRLPLIVMAMGKLGGYELNVSSDIDIVFLFDDIDTNINQTNKEYKEISKEIQKIFAGHESLIHISHLEYFEKLAQRVVQGLNKITEHGFVFRVDLRLRPYGEIGSIVCSIGMFEDYLLTQGRAWERFAWLKARQVYPAAKHSYLANLIRSFVYRRYLDYNLLEALRSVHQKIEAEQRKKGCELNIKLGSGGIREIEFITQVHQLIHGGQNTQLQTHETLQALDLLAQHHILEQTNVDKLKTIYIQHRNLEHAIQYLRDEHTHIFPAYTKENLHISTLANIDDTNIKNQKKWHNITYLSGTTNNTEHLQDTLTANRFFVKNIFNQIFYAEEVNKKANQKINQKINQEINQKKHLELQNNNDNNNKEHNLKLPLDYFLDIDDLQINSLFGQYLTVHQFNLPGQILAHMHSILQGSRYRLLSQIAQKSFHQAIYLGVAYSKDLSNKDNSFIRYLDFLHTISQRRSYLSLLVEHPHIIQKLIGVLAHSAWVSQYIIQHPQVIDELLRVNHHIEFDWQDYRLKLAAKMNHPHDELEHKMDNLRQHYHAYVFRILLSEISGQHNVLEIADLLSALVDATLEETIHMVWKNIQMNEPIPYFAIIAYGKLGGKELGYASDLDLVFLYDETQTELNEAANSYTYLARKLITWLTSNTSSGKVFEIDTRLRPNGQAGLLVSSVQAFAAYQKQRISNSAWTWEHQALTRARFCAGNPEIGKMFEAIRCDILSVEKDNNALKHKIIKMREKILQEKKYPQDVFNLKYSLGGMIDIEFVVQYLVLAYAYKYPKLLLNLGNIQLLNIAADYALISHKLSKNAAQAYQAYRKMQYELRLDNKKSLVDINLVTQHIQNINALWHYVMLN